MIYVVEILHGNVIYCRYDHHMFTKAKVLDSLNHLVIWNIVVGIVCSGAFHVLMTVAFGFYRFHSKYWQYYSSCE